MNILFTRFPLESSYGGAEVQTLTLAEGLRKRGHTVAFLGSCPILCEGMAKLQIPSTKLAIGDPPVTKWGAVSFLWRKEKMRRKLVKEVTTCFDTALLCHTERSRSTVAAPTQHDVCIFMLSLSEKLLLTDWAASKGIKVFWVEHDRIGRWLTMNPWLPKLRMLSKLATTIVVSDLSRDLYLKLGWPAARIVTILNGIDTLRFIPNPNSSTSPNPFHIGCIARLTYDKGVDLLIDAVQDLPNVTLTIIGTGREEERLQQRARCKFLKSVPDIPAFYHSLDVLVLPSRSHDPFGLVVAEAMAAGVPTIVTDACGIVRHLSAGDALIVQAGNAAALRNAIQTLLALPKLRSDLAQRGPRIARERFSQERMVTAYGKLLR